MQRQSRHNRLAAGPITMPALVVGETYYVKITQP